MGFSSYAGAGIGEGLEKATNTLLQIQMAKYKMGQQAQEDKVTTNYKKAQTEFLNMQMANQETMAKQAIAQAQQQKIFEAGQQAALGMANDGTGDTGVSPVAGFSSVANGQGALPQPQQPQTQILMGANGKYYQKPVSQASSNVTPQQDIQLAVKGVAEGKIPPEKIASYRDVTRVNAELERQGINLSDLTLEWDATKKAVQTMNGPQQIRLRQAINFGLKSTDDIVKMSDALSRGSNPILNRAQLGAAKQGLLGADMQQKATLLDQQIADTVSDLGQVYMGGNSPTDKGLELAGQNLKGDWSAPQLKAAAQNIKKLLSFRLNAVNGSMAYVPGGEAKQTYGKGAVKDQGDNQPSQEDLEFTAKKYGISVDEVKQKMGIE